MNYNHNLIFKSNKKELEMNDKTDIKVIDIQGIEASSYTINTAQSEQDGSTVTSVKIEAREITITGDIEKNESELVNREKLIRFFNPKQEGEIIITRNNISRKIQYRVSSLDFITNKMYECIDFTLVLESTEEPYFSDAKNSGNYLTAVSPQFTFPLIISPTKIMGYRTFKPVMPLVNDGDKETGIEIIVTAKRGKMDNIKLILNNNEYIKVNVTLNQWDELRINTNPRKKSVMLNGVNIINKIDRNSTFFNLKIGKNILKYECENGNTNIDIDVQFYRKYLGV
ncbi:MAG: phage tail family protein [Clostridia bacterium]|nr:phage tail family protein [Clostridia bacterium]